MVGYKPEVVGYGLEVEVYRLEVEVYEHMKGIFMMIHTSLSILHH